MTGRKLVITDTYGGLSSGDRFTLTYAGEQTTSIVMSASYYDDDPAGTIIWSVQDDDGTAWDLFPRDLLNRTFRRT